MRCRKSTKTGAAAVDCLYKQCVRRRDALRPLLGAGSCLPMAGRKTKAEPTAARPGITASENAVFCYLRQHPDVAASYGIHDCGDSTTTGSMLQQTLKAQGAQVNWYERLPNGVDPTSKELAPNKRAAVWMIKDMTKRPRSRIKPLSERPEVAPPDKAAIARHHGRLPRQSFPLLIKFGASRRRRVFSGQRSARAAT